MIVGVLLAVHSFIGSNTLLDLAVITYMSAPATFSMQTFLKREDGSAYVSTTNSLYCNCVDRGVYDPCVFYILK